MTQSGNIGTILEFCRVWQERDLAKIMQFFSPDCFYHNIPVEPIIGTEAIEGFLKPMVEGAGMIEFIVKFAAESAEGAVLTERLDRFELGGRMIAVPVMGTFQLKDGKITHWRDYYDQAQFTSQMAAAAE